MSLVACDWDGTLWGDEAAARTFRDRWNRFPDQRRPLLCYNTGRLVKDVVALLKTGVLPAPDFIVGGLGTEVYDYRRKRKLDRPLPQGARWDRAALDGWVARLPGMELQPPQVQTPLKSSWYWRDRTPEAVEAIRTALSRTPFGATVLYSSQRDLDFLPLGIDKGSSLAWLCGQLQVPLDEVVVAGDSGNDAAAFLLPQVRGIVVGNAHGDLVDAVRGTSFYRALQHEAWGVLEGLDHFGWEGTP